VESLLLSSLEAIVCQWHFRFAMALRKVYPIGVIPDLSTFKLISSSTFWVMGCTDLVL
jgi:hypothetical protein